MKLKILITIVFYLTVENFAHNHSLNNQGQLDSNYIAFLRIKGLLGEEYNSYVTDTKCGFRIINSVKYNIGQYSQEKREKIQSVLQRPTKQATLVTPSGKFKIHYDTIGTHAITYSVYDLALALDSTYNYEVNVMGFPPAPEDFFNGGDNKYDVYVHNISPTYGYTELENPIGNGRYTSFIVIDNSFHEDSYYTKGIDAARVTVAHEYHHAIQIGNYRYANTDVWFYELTSTSMEEFVFDSINDYYSYMPNFFNRPDKIFTGFDGYSQAVWNIYLHKIFDYDYSIFIRQWEFMRNFSALESIKKSIEEKGKSFKTVFSQFYIYNYFTGYRSKPDKYYKEGENYPLVGFNYPIQFIGSSKTISGYGQPCSANYYLVIDSVSRIPFPPDSIVILLVNTNVDSALNWSGTTTYFSYKIKISSSQLDASYKEISTNIYTKIEVNDPANWTDYYIINDTTTLTTLVNVAELAFPMPANLNKHSSIKIPVPVDWAKEIELYIYSSGMDLIYSSKKVPQVFDNKVVVVWNGRDQENKKVASGIYFYFLVNDDKKSIGKIVIINE